MGVYIGDYIDGYRAVYRAIYRDNYIAINYIDVYIANYRTFLVY